MADYDIQVIVDPKNANSGLDSVDARLNKTEKSARLLQGALRQLSALGLGLSFGAAVTTIANFDQEMSSLGAVANATDKQLKVLRQTAIDLGGATRFSATEAASAMKLLAQAGFSVDQTLGAAQGTLDLAQAGNLGLANAADIAANALNGFRLGVDQTSRVVDVLVATANMASTDVTQLGDAMKYVAPIAAGLGISLEETAAALGVLSNAGLQGSMAGTGLRQVLSSLEAPTSDVVKVLKALHIRLEDVQPSAVGLTKAIQALREGGVGTAEALKLFGDRGGPAFEVLSSGIPKVKELTTALGNAEGTAARVAKQMDDNLYGSIQNLLGAFESLILTAGDSGFTAVLRLLIDGFAGLIRLITPLAPLLTAIGAAMGLNLAVSFIKGSTAVMSFVRAAVIAQASLGTFGAATSLAGLAWARFNAILALSPLGRTATVLILVAGLVLSFIGDMETLNAVLNNAWQILTAIGNVISAVVVASLNALGISASQATVGLYAFAAVITASLLPSLIRLGTYMLTTLAAGFLSTITYIGRLVIGGVISGAVVAVNLLSVAFTGLNLRIIAITLSIAAIIGLFIILIKDTEEVKTAFADLGAVLDKTINSASAAAVSVETLGNTVSDVSPKMDGFGDHTKKTADSLDDFADSAKKAVKEGIPLIGMLRQTSANAITGVSRVNSLGRSVSEYGTTATDAAVRTQQLGGSMNSTGNSASSMARQVGQATSALNAMASAAASASSAVASVGSSPASITGSSFFNRSGGGRAGFSTVRDGTAAEKAIAQQAQQLAQDLYAAGKIGIEDFTKAMNEAQKVLSDQIPIAYYGRTVGSGAAWDPSTLNNLRNQFLEQQGKQQIRDAMAAAMASTSSTKDFQTYSPYQKAVPGYKDGVDGIVGGSGGPDSKYLRAKVSPGEQVKIIPKRKQKEENRPQVVQEIKATFNIQTQDVNSFRRNRAQVEGDFLGMVKRAQRRAGVTLNG